MRKISLSILSCPSCKGEIIKEKNALKCETCSIIYSIFNNVPIMLTNYKAKDFEKTRESFSKEWDMFKKGDKTWIWNHEERIDLFAKEIDVKNLNELKGKTVLDAGCGNGQLTSLIGD